VTEEDPLPPSKTEDEVGYARPPRHTRFQPGRSGNPKGRPKGVKSLGAALLSELEKQVVVTEGGKRKRLPKREALAKQLINKALNNDPKAANLVLAEVRRMELPEDKAAAVEFLRADDKLVMKDIIRRIRLAEEPASDADCPEEEEKQ
jgi:hypothetical protein